MPASPTFVILPLPAREGRVRGCRQRYRYPPLHREAVFRYTSLMPLDDDFLKQKRFQRQSLRPEEKEAVDAAKCSRDRRARARGEKIDWAKPGALVANYLQRFREILDRRPTPERRERAVEALKERLHQELLINVDHEVFTVSPPERIREILAAPKNPHGKPLDPHGKPYSLSHFDKRIIRFSEEGRGIGTVPEEERQREIDDIFKEQQRSLDTWIDYLASSDAKYPDPLKYWALRSILKMGRFDKDKHTFTNREGGGSTSPFPDLNREALAIILGDTEKKYAGRTDFAFLSRYDIAQEQKDAYRRALGMGTKDSPEDFATLYALAIDAFKPISEDLLKITDGVWMTYPQGSDPLTSVPTATLNGKTVTGLPLVPALADYGTGWCLRGEPTARRYLKDNTLSVYFSRTSSDPSAPALVPRVVMVMNPQNQITEVRGIKAHEHLDADILPVVDAALSSHPDGLKYQKKTKDMERLTTLDRLLKSNTFHTLPPEDQRSMLTFLYECDAPIEGFGYEAAGRDPRIQELRSKRNPDEDMLTLFGDEHGPCRPDQIAHHPSEIRPDTRAYIGPLLHKDAQGEIPLIFRLLAHVPNIYTSFPEGRIRLESLEIGGMTAEELEQALEDAGIKTSTYSKSMLRNKRQFIDPVNKHNRERKGSTETLDLVRLHIRDLGFTSMPTTRELLGEFDAEGNLTKEGRIHELGFEFCPLETGPYKRLADKDQSPGDWYYIGMQPVTASGGGPGVFRCVRDGDGAWLSGRWALPDDHWYLDAGIVLRPRKSVA